MERHESFARKEGYYWFQPIGLGFAVIVMAVEINGTWQIFSVGSEKPVMLEELKAGIWEGPISQNIETMQVKAFSGTHREMAVN